jgi:hypothetical protein
MKKKCIDCQNCASRDVFKGYCEAKDESVLIDTPADSCPKFTVVDKCRICKKYEPSDNEFLGNCNGKLVYPDLSGCLAFEALG